MPKEALALSLPAGLVFGKHYDFGRLIKAEGCIDGQNDTFEAMFSGGELIEHRRGYGELVFLGVPHGSDDGALWVFWFSQDECDNFTEIDPPRKQDAV